MRGKEAMPYFTTPHSSWSIQGQWTVRGQISWAQLQLDTSILSLMVIYAPSDSPRERAYIWHQPKIELLDMNWILLEDFNITKDPQHSSRPTPLLQGRHLEAWRLLAMWLDLIDAFLLPKTFVGTCFTRRAVHGKPMDQSHIDCFYVRKRQGAMDKWNP